MLFVIAQQDGTHHGAQCQGDQPGDKHGARERQRKFRKQLAGAPRCEGNRRINGGKRQGHGDYGARNFAYAFHGGMKGFHALFNMAVDIFKDNNGIIDNQANRQHHGKQGQGVDGKAHQAH